jgi:DNA-binding CsgD family transcriptional regulator
MRQERNPAPRLFGRRSECEALDQLVADVAGGHSRVVVLRGDAGSGKTALLNYLASRVEDWTVTRAAGVESEAELAYSSIHQLCAPFLDRLGILPGPQQNALATVFGLSSGRAPDPFLVGLATLTLLADVAEAQPVLCVIEDAHWLDRASAQVLGFVARRLLAERIAIACAVRTGVGDQVLAGLPDLAVLGLQDSEARALLLESVRVPLDAAICDQIVAESHGNPLALLELPRTMSASALAGGYGALPSQAVSGKVEQSYAQRLHQLPYGTQLFVLTAAAEPLGDPVLLYRATQALGLDISAVEPAVNAGLLEVGARVTFAHPLVRSAAYGTAPSEDRRRAHLALAEATDPTTDPDRRAWHAAGATAGPSEEVAAELERSADRAQARGGFAAAAAFLQRAVALTVDPSRRAQRALAAANASLQAGAFEDVLALLATTDAGPLDDFQRAQVQLLRGHVAFGSGIGPKAAAELFQAARGLEPFDLEVARQTYLIAWAAAGMAGDAGGDLYLDICRAAYALPKSESEPTARELVLEGHARLTAEGWAAATPLLQQAAQMLVELPIEEVNDLGFMAAGASSYVWDIEAMLSVTARQAQLVRDTGALSSLPFCLAQLGMVRTWMGDLEEAAALVVESDDVATAIGSPLAPYTRLRLQALQGREAEASATIAETTRQAALSGQGMAAALANHAAAVLYNGLARYDEALSAATDAAANRLIAAPYMLALPELVEAAVRSGKTARGREALALLTAITQPIASDLALGLEARCRALLAAGVEAEDYYRESTERLGRTRVRTELARSHLVYGEWLRREGRRMDAREQLRIGHTMFVDIGMDGFAERTRRELAATGEVVRKRRDETRGDLTPQEQQIARLARDGLTNPEIGAQLFLSPRTIEWHLRNVFGKLGIESRRELDAALPERNPGSPPK